jgi:hypothetical protein
MSSKSFIEHLQTSGTDFYNSHHYTENDFMSEKQMEMDILGLTDDSDSDLNSDLNYNYDSNYDSSISHNSNNSNNSNIKIDSKKTINISGEIDDKILKSLASSINKEEIFFTDTESDTESNVYIKTDIDTDKVNLEINSHIKEIEQYFASDNTNNKLFEKINNKGSVFASTVYKNDNYDLPQYASYMHLETNKMDIRFNLLDFIKEFIIIIILHCFLGINNAMFNVITIDGIISCLIFYMNSILHYKKADNLLEKIRLITIDRYIYYLLLFIAVHIIDYVTWFQYSEITMYLASFIICPSITAQIYKLKSYSKVRQVLYDGYNNLIKKIICKQLAKIINIFIDKVLNLKIIVKYTDLMNHYHDFDFLVINKFIVTFILALIFNHVDKGSLKIPLMIYKNLYMKDNKYKIKDDKKYLTKIIKDHKWGKFLDIYTLNRMIRMLIDNDNKDDDLSTIINNLVKKIFFRINRVLFCYTVMNMTNSLTIGVITFLLFISNAKKPLRYLLNVLLFSWLSCVTKEKILILVVCEISFTVANSKLVIDVIRDTYNFLCKIVRIVYDNTRVESIFFSVLLSSLSLLGLNWLSMTIITIINMILFTKFKKCDLNIGKIRAKQNNKHNEEESILGITNNMNLSFIKTYLSMISDNLNYSENNLNYSEKNKQLLKNNNSINKNSDVIKYILNGIKSNTLFKVLFSSDTIDKLELYRILGYYFSLLIFGYISRFTTLHVILLPIVIQNVVDVIW